MTWSELILDDKNCLLFLFGLLLCVLVVFLGLNIVIFYVFIVFMSVGINNLEILIWAVGVSNVVGGFVVLVLLDKMGC